MKSFIMLFFLAPSICLAQSGLFLWGSFNQNLEFEQSSLSYEIYTQTAFSEIFEGDVVAINYLSFPSNLAQRDSFNLTASNYADGNQSLLGLNKLSYKERFENGSLEFGRFFITHGEGMLLNPVNPFNSTTRFSASPLLNQGNDGFRLALTKDPNFHLNIMVLGDRTYTEDHGENTKSLILHGDWTLNENYHLHYLLGEDQNRHFYGIELKHRTRKQLIFIQIAGTTQDLADSDAEQKSLQHYLLGIEQRVTNDWSSRLEYGKFEQDTESRPLKTNFYLPIQKALGWMNTLQVSDRARAKMDYVLDLVSEAQFTHLQFLYTKNQWLEVGVYVIEQVGAPKTDLAYAEQRNFPQIYGLSIGVKY